MAFKFETQGNYFVITNTVTNYEILRKALTDIYLVSNGTRIRFNDITSDQVLPDRDGYEFSQIVDVNGNPFADFATLLTYLSVKTGNGQTKPFIKSNEDLSLAQRKGDVLYGILDQYTGEEITLSKITTVPIVDNIIYFQLGSEYFKRQYTIIKDSWFGIVADGISDDTLLLKKLFNSLEENDIIEFRSKIYILNTPEADPLILNKNNIKIFGIGCEIKKIYSLIICVFKICALNI